MNPLHPRLQPRRRLLLLSVRLARSRANGKRIAGLGPGHAAAGRGSGYAFGVSDTMTLLGISDPGI